MRALLLFLLACGPEPAVTPDAGGCPRLPMDGWYHQSGSCITTVAIPPERRVELSRLRDAFVLFVAGCPSPECGPVPEVPPMPTTDVCADWKAWDSAMDGVADWARCAAK